MGNRRYPPNAHPPFQCMFPKLLTPFGGAHRIRRNNDFMVDPLWDARSQEVEDVGVGIVMGHVAIGKEQFDFQWLAQDPDAGGQHHPT